MGMKSGKKQRVVGDDDTLLLLISPQRATGRFESDPVRMDVSIDRQ